MGTPSPRASLLVGAFGLLEQYGSRSAGVPSFLDAAQVLETGLLDTTTLALSGRLCRLSVRSMMLEG